MLLYIGVIITALTLIGLGYFLLAQNRKTPVVTSFGIFVLVLSVWLITNFSGANFKHIEFTKYFIYADFVLGPWATYLFWRFGHSLLRQVGVRSQAKVDTSMLCVAIGASLLSVSGLIVQVQFVNGGLLIEYQRLFWVYAAAVLSLASVAFGSVLIAKRKSVNPLRRQLKVMTLGLYVVLVALFFANLVVPQLTTSRGINLLVGNLAYLGILFFGATTTYAIIKHRLFDIRLVVARSIGYTFVLVSVSLMYFVLALAFSLLFSTDYTIAIQDQLLYIFSAILAAVAFNPLKRFFDKVTNRYFYRDAYDPQILFDEYNKALVSTIDLDVLLKRTANVIAEYLKAEYCSIGVKDGSEQEYRIIGTKAIAFDTEDIAIVRKKAPGLHQSVIVAEELLPNQKALDDILRKYDTTLLIHLTTDFHHAQEGMGYMALGPKKSGNPYTNHDVKVLETLANELIIALQNALRFEEIERFSETLQRKVEDATRQLRVSNKKLKDLNETKDDFIGMASHQLRTPLTSVKGYISLVMDGDAGKINQQQYELLRQAFVSSQRMVYLIADLLNISRLKTGKFNIERAPTNLARLINDELAQLKETAASRNIELQFEAPPNFPDLSLDETKTRQVIMNFIDNAIYYTPAGGHIRVELEESPKSIELRVTDDGIGVPEAERHHLWTKFYRAKNAQRARPDGTGLGLYMAKKVITAQGGAIVFDTKEGQGSTFGFTFPKDLPTESGVVQTISS